jgi:hypothetical protein
VHEIWSGVYDERFEMLFSLLRNADITVAEILAFRPTQGLATILATKKNYTITFNILIVCIAAML